MVDNKFVRWNDKKYHPNERCEATVKTGQCPYCKHGVSNYCVMHGANNSNQVQLEKTKRAYRLGRWQERVSEFADGDGVKCLREEIGILRMMLEDMFAQCQDSTDLLLYSQRMSDLVMKIEKLVVSCDKLENRMGMLLSKESVLQLASNYVNIINLHVSDPAIIEKISMDMVEATESVGA